MENTILYCRAKFQIKKPAKISLAPIDHKSLFIVRRLSVKKLLY